MYFFSRHNKLYSFAASIRPLYRYLLTFLIIASLSYGWFYGIYIPLEKIIKLYGQEIDEAKNKSITLKHEQRQKKELESSLQELEIKHHSYSTKNVEQTFDTKIQTILKNAQRSGLELRSYNTDKQIDKQWYTKEIIQSSFSGTLEQVINFFDFIATSHAMIQCKDLEITHQQDAIFSINCQLHLIAIR